MMEGSLVDADRAHARIPAPHFRGQPGIVIDC